MKTERKSDDEKYFKTYSNFDFVYRHSYHCRWVKCLGVLLSGWDKSPSLSIVFGLSSKTQWLSGIYYADFISFYSPTQLCGGGTTKSNSNELPISVPLSYNCLQQAYKVST